MIKFYKGRARGLAGKQWSGLRQALRDGSFPKPKMDPEPAPPQGKPKEPGIVALEKLHQQRERAVLDDYAPNALPPEGIRTLAEFEAWRYSDAIAKARGEDG